MSKKINVGDEVKVKSLKENGIVMEVNPASDGGDQYRVRHDFTDTWFPEKDLTVITKAEPDQEPTPPKAPTPPTV